MGERRSEHGGRAREKKRERGRERWRGRGRRGAAHPGGWATRPIQTLAAAAHPDGGGRQVWELFKADERDMLQRSGFI